MRTFSLTVSLLTILFTLLIIGGIVAHPAPNELLESVVSPEIQFAVQLSLFTASVSTAMCIAVALPVAYALVRYTVPGKPFVNMILDIPLALPPLVAGVGLLLFFGTTGFGKGLAEVGLQFVFTPLGIIMAQFFVNLPFMLRVTRSTFQAVNPRYEYVAKTLGCTDAQAFWRVTLPMSRHGIFAGSVITWAKGIGEFGAALILAGATRMRTETLPISIFLNMSIGKLTMAISAAVLLILISVAALYIFERYGGDAHIY
jgi:molybdate transport system permease protein